MLRLVAGLLLTDVSNWILKDEGSEFFFFDTSVINKKCKKPEDLITKRTLKCNYL